jgi:hypothetical protein
LPAARAKKPGFAGLRWRSGHAGALRAPSNPLRGRIRETTDGTENADIAQTFVVI